MMKIKALRRRLMIESGAVLGILAVSGVLGWFLSDLTDKAEGQKNMLSGEVAGFENRALALRSKISRFQGGSPEFRKLFTEEGEEELTLKRDQTVQVFDELSAQYALDDMRVSLETVKEMQDGNYRKPRAIGISSEGTVTFKSFNDVQAVEFIQALQQRMPAVVKIIRLEMKAPSAGAGPGMPASGNASAGSPTVDNTLQFLWMGLKDPAPKKQPDPLAIPQPGAAP